MGVLQSTVLHNVPQCCNAKVSVEFYFYFIAMYCIVVLHNEPLSCIAEDLIDFVVLSVFLDVVLRCIGYCSVA